MSKAIILSIIARLDQGLLPAGQAPKASQSGAIKLRAWACVPAMSKTVVAGEPFLIVDKKLTSLKAATDEQLLGLIATYDRQVIAAGMVEAGASFNKLVASDGIQSTSLGAVTDKVMGDGIAWNATGKAIFWKAAPAGFTHAAAVEPVKTLMAEFQLEPGILDGVDAVNLQLLADQTGTSVRALRSMNLSRDHKVLADLALRVINIVSVFKLEGERQVTMAELNAAVEGLRVNAEGGPVDQDGKPFDPKDLPAARKMAKERREGMESMDEELRRTGRLTNHPVKAGAITKEFDPKGEQVQPTDKDHMDQLLKDEKRPAVIIDVVPEKDPLKVKQTLYTAKEVSVADLQKNAGKYALAQWCVTMDQAKKHAKWLELRRADYQPLPDHWEPPAAEAAGDGVKEEKDEMNGGKRMVVKEIKTPSSPQAIESTDKIDNLTDQVQKLRNGQVMAKKRVKADAMQKQVFEADGIMVETTDGVSTWFPAEVLGGKEATVENVKDYVEGEPAKVEKVHGWFGRYSMPGYMDATEWVFDEDQAACEQELERLYGMDDDGVEAGKKLKASDLRSVRVTFDDGNVIDTNMAAGVSDEEIKAYYSTGREFNVGSGADDKMAKVSKVEILASNVGPVTVSFTKKDNAKGPEDDEVEATVKPASEEVGKVLETAGYKKVGDGVYAIYKVDQWAAMDAFKKALAQSGAGAVVEEAEHTLVVESGAPMAAAAKPKGDGRPKPDTTGSCYRCDQKKPLYTVQFEFNPGRPNEHICWDCMSPRLQNMFKENKTAYDMQAAADQWTVIVDKDTKKEVKRFKNLDQKQKQGLLRMYDSDRFTINYTSKPKSNVKAEKTPEQQEFEDGIFDQNDLTSEDINGADVRIYDNGGETFDRYSIVVENPETQERSWLGSSENPYHPSGFGQHLGDRVQEGAHLGTQIKFADLPEQVQRFVRNEAEAYAADSTIEGNAGRLMAAPKDPKKKTPAKKKKVPSKKVPKQAEDETTVGDAVGETPKAEADDEGAAPAKPKPKGKEEAVGGDVNKLIDEKLGKTEDAPAPAAEGEGGDFKAKARAALATELGAQPDDLEDAEVYYPNDQVEAVAFDHGSKEYVVYATDDDAEKAAQESVRNDFGPNGEGPDLFNQDFIMGHVDREALRAYMSQVFDEFAEQDVEELSTKDKEEWLEKEGLMPDNYLDDDAFDVDTLFEQHRETWVQEQVNEKLGNGNDSGQSWWEENVGEEEFRKIIKDNGFIDVESLVEEAVSADGAGHFLSSYDGVTHDLPGGMVYIRTN